MKIENIEKLNELVKRKKQLEQNVEIVEKGIDVEIGTDHIYARILFLGALKQELSEVIKAIENLD